jgi:hypothetical protein
MKKNILLIIRVIFSLLTMVFLYSVLIGIGGYFFVEDPKVSISLLIILVPFCMIMLISFLLGRYPFSWESYIGGDDDFTFKTDRLLYNLIIAFSLIGMLTSPILSIFFDGGMHKVICDLFFILCSVSFSLIVLRLSYLTNNKQLDDDPLG